MECTISRSDGELHAKSCFKTLIFQHSEKIKSEIAAMRQELAKKDKEMRQELAKKDEEMYQELAKLEAQLQSQQAWPPQRQVVITALPLQHSNNDCRTPCLQHRIATMTTTLPFSMNSAGGEP